MSSGATIQKITAKLIKAPGRVVAVGIRILRRRTEVPLTRSILMVQALLSFEELASSGVAVFNDLKKHL